MVEPKCPVLIGPRPSEAAAVPGSGPCRLCLSCCALFGAWTMQRMKKYRHVIETPDPGRWEVMWINVFHLGRDEGRGNWNVQCQELVPGASRRSLPLAAAPCQTGLASHSSPGIATLKLLFHLRQMGTMSCRRTDPSEQLQMLPRCVLPVPQCLSNA